MNRSALNKRISVRLECLVNGYTFMGRGLADFAHILLCSVVETTITYLFLAVT